MHEKELADLEPGTPEWLLLTMHSALVGAGINVPPDLAKAVERVLEGYQITLWRVAVRANGKPEPEPEPPA